MIHFVFFHPFVLLHVLLPKLLEFDLLLGREHRIDLVMEGLMKGLHFSPLLLLGKSSVVMDCFYLLRLVFQDGF